MSNDNWLEKIYIGAKNTIKTGYNINKEYAKDAIDFVFGSDSDVYKFCAKTAHITEPIFSGITETLEFVGKNPKETGAILSDIAGWVIENEDLDSKRLLNFLYKYSRETGSDVKELLKELPPDSLSSALKYTNNKLSDMKKIPCSQVCMDIALSNPKKIKTDEYWTTNNKKLEDTISHVKDSKNYNPDRFNQNMPVIEFKANGQHARMLQENDKLQDTLRTWAKSPEDKKNKIINIALDTKSDKENGYDSYATFHNITILNPKVDKDGNITAYAYDVYDFERASFNGQMLDFATIMAYHLQETGHLQNYKMLIPITIPAEAIAE